ncbi:response regulator [Halopseudomonas sp.]|jgi:CheY-like chemotaxis protein|uniref:ATP-binding response regulator n=1 Tax=Halopseudomonas sp. TaxID=2901191 RepID=UPI0039E6A677
MVHGIIEQLGGKLKLHSEPGQGTRAQLWLPVYQGEEPVVGHEAITPAADAAVALRVLAVDDDALVLTNTCALLEEIGHRSFSAGSAAEALAFLEQETVDLVITDHAMPLMTGSQLADLLHQRYPGLPVILATGYLEIGHQQTDNTPLLAKPFDEQDLVQVISRAVRRSKGQG